MSYYGLTFGFCLRAFQELLKRKCLVFDSSRNLKRGCRTPWLPDDENIGYLLKGYMPSEEDADKDFSEEVVSVATPAKRGRASSKKDAEAVNDEENDDSLIKTPAKRGRASSKKDAEVVNDGDNEDTAAALKKKPRKRGKSVVVVVDEGDDINVDSDEAARASLGRGKHLFTPHGNSSLPNICDLVEKQMEGMVSTLMDKQKILFTECQRQLEATFQTHLKSQQKEIDKIKDSIQNLPRIHPVVNNDQSLSKKQQAEQQKKQQHDLEQCKQQQELEMQKKHQSIGLSPIMTTPNMNMSK